MLERYFLRPNTVDKIRASWIGEPIEQYVTWLTEQNYSSRSVLQRVPLLLRFGAFAHSRGARNWAELPDYVEPFVDAWLFDRGQKKVAQKARIEAIRSIRGPIQHWLRLVVPGYCGGRRGYQLSDPFADGAPGFFSYLRSERGLRESTISQYIHQLRYFEAYLQKIKLYALSELSATVLSAFITERSQGFGKRAVQRVCGTLRVFLRYLYRENLISRDLSPLIESPQQFSLAPVPRSITWKDVQQMLEAVDCRTAVGKRDYAVLLLLVTYGLRAREVAALTLDDLDWKQERLYVPERKAGHSAAYPLSPIVGKAILDYLQHGRPHTSERALFFRAVAPYTPMSWTAVSLRAKHYLRKAGINVPRPGSHTLRHTCVQRLVDSHMSLKTIGDYVGHRTPDATAVYTKVQIEALREIALSDGEEIV